jgi:hypothetical protein
LLPLPYSCLHYCWYGYWKPTYIVKVLRFKKGPINSLKSTAMPGQPKRATAKKKAAKAPAKKTAPKKITKKAAKKATPKKAIPPKKRTVAKKKAVTKNLKPAAHSSKASITVKTRQSKTAVITTATEKTKPVSKKETVQPIDTNLPPVEEKSPAINPGVTTVPGMDKKSMQRAAVRNYDNHHLRLSNHSKGGIKPSGKKPLW